MWRAVQRFDSTGTGMRTCVVCVCVCVCGPAVDMRGSGVSRGNGLKGAPKAKSWPDYCMSQGVCKQEVVMLGVQRCKSHPRSPAPSSQLAVPVTAGSCKSSQAAQGWASNNNAQQIVHPAPPSKEATGQSGGGRTAWQPGRASAAR